MTTPEPPGEPTPPSFEKPATGGSPYQDPPYQDPPDRPLPQYPTAPPPGGGNPYTDDGGGVDAGPYARNPYPGNPYAADPHGAPPVPGQRPEDRGPGTKPPLGGLGERLVARIIDWVIMLVLGGVVGTAVVLGSNIAYVYIGTVTIVFAGLFGLVYEGLMLSRAGGQTLGKKAMRIRVAMLADGAVPTGTAAWIRSAVFWVPAILSGFCLPALFSLLDILWCTWDRPFRQCLHDKAARTVVVKAG